MVLVNGQESDCIVVHDRGFTLADGFFSTVQIRDGALLLWPYHAARLRESAQRLGFPELDLASVQQRAARLAAGQTMACLRIQFTRGSGGRGYSPAGTGVPTEVLSLHPYPAHYADWRHSGIPLGICQGRIGQAPMLAGLKTLNRLEQVLLKAELDRRQWAEALVLDADDYLVECVTANLFWRHNSVVYTPDLQCAGVAGVMRQWVMDQLAEQGIACQTVRSRLSALYDADEVFISNALMEVVPVNGIEDVSYSDHALARRLQSCAKDMA